MKWYVITCPFGDELTVKDQLISKGITALVPREVVLIRRGGNWHEELKILYPCYVFINCVYTPDIFHKLKTVDSFKKILPNAINPVPLFENEVNALITLCPDDSPILPSAAVQSGDRIEIISGALRNFKGEIVKIKSRQKRATVKTYLFGQEKLVELSLSIIKKSEEEALVDSSQNRNSEDIK